MAHTQYTFTRSGMKAVSFIILAAVLIAISLPHCEAGVVVKSRNQDATNTNIRQVDGVGHKSKENDLQYGDSSQKKTNILTNNLSSNHFDHDHHHRRAKSKSKASGKSKSSKSVSESKGSKSGPAKSFKSKDARDDRLILTTSKPTTAIPSSSPSLSIMPTSKSSSEPSLSNPPSTSWPSYSSIPPHVQEIVFAQSLSSSARAIASSTSVAFILLLLPMLATRWV